MTTFLQLLAALALLGLALPAPAQDAEADPWTRLRETVTRQGERLKEALQSQQEQEAIRQEQESELERSRKLRAMHREAVLLSELNVAWIRDQLDHWDCRVAEQAVVEVQLRIDQLSQFNQRIDSLCGSLQADDQAQRQVCARQREDVARRVDQLHSLAQRYQSQCP